MSAAHSTSKRLVSVPDPGTPRPRLGDVLIRSGALTEEQLDHALAQQARNHRPLGELLIKLGYITDDKMRQALARQLHISFVDLDGITIDKQLAKVINSAFARRRSKSTSPGSSSGGSVSGGQARQVTPPAAAASISDSSVAL